MGRPGPDPHQEETPAGTRIASRIYVSADALRWIEEHDAAPDNLGPTGLPANPGLVAGAYPKEQHAMADDRHSQARRWRSDRLRDRDEFVRWRPTIPVSGVRTWAGPAVDGRWLVGTPNKHVLFAHSAAGVVALLPLLERPMAEVAAELEVASLTRHSLDFERVVGDGLECACWRPLGSLCNCLAQRRIPPSRARGRPAPCDH